MSEQDEITADIRAGHGTDEMVRRARDRRAARESTFIFEGFAIVQDGGVHALLTKGATRMRLPIVLEPDQVPSEDLLLERMAIELDALEDKMAAYREFEQKYQGRIIEIPTLEQLGRRPEPEVESSVFADESKEDGR